jgi:glycerate kinase
MRVIVCSDAIGSLPSAAAGAVLAQGWPRARTEVLAMASAGERFAPTIAQLSGTDPAADVTTGVLSSVVDTPERLIVCPELNAEYPVPADRHASSAVFGEAVRAAIEASPYRAPEVVVDVSGNSARDAGAGLLAGLGAGADVDLRGGAAGLSGAGRVDLGPAQDLLAGRELVLVVPDHEQRSLLLGLRGITAVEGRANEWPPELMLATDAALQSFTAAAAPDRPDEPGWGACGGAGFAAAALGGRVVAGADYCAELTGLDGRCRGADLVVTGCSTYDFAHRGGAVVARTVRAGTDALAPVILIAAEVFIGQREMRAMGVESAYPVRDPLHQSVGDEQDQVDPEQLAGTARRVGRSWTW